MSNETKQDVFDETLSNLKKMDAQIEGEWGYSQLTMGVGKHGCVESIREIAIAEIRDRYEAALPDDLPVIPKAVGISIKEQKEKQRLGGVIFDAIFAVNTLGRKGVGLVVNWIVDNNETFARAWVLGVWRVEETGEIVKLEAEVHDVG